MVDTAAANSTLKRKASRSPPPEDVAPKRVKPGVLGEEVSTENGDANGNTKGSSNDTVGDKPDNGDTSAPSPKRANRDAELPVDLRGPSSDRKPADSNANGKSPEQARRPSISSGTDAVHKEIAQEEKKRAKRLFGGLLSTLSQTANSQPKRKHDIDRRQTEKAQQQRADDERRRAKKLDERKAIRKQQQEKLDEEMMEVRHANMLARAHSLQTIAKPRLYYQPWEPTKEQEDIIDDQIRKAKETIETERQEFRLRRGISDNNHSHSRNESGEGPHGGASPRPGATVGERKNSLQDANRGVPAAHAPSQTIKDKDRDEEMVQDKEDTVIY